MTDIQAALGLSQMANLKPGSASAVNWPRRYFEAHSARTSTATSVPSGAVRFIYLCTTWPRNSVQPGFAQAASTGHRCQRALHADI